MRTFKLITEANSPNFKAINEVHVRESLSPNQLRNRSSYEKFFSKVSCFLLYIDAILIH
jgi:hypothetical protein